MSVEQHKDLGSLVADIRNKMGAPYNFFSLLNEMKKEDQPDDIKLILNNLLKNSEDVCISSMEKLVDLLDQFEKYDLDNIKPTP